MSYINNTIIILKFRAYFKGNLTDRRECGMD